MRQRRVHVYASGRVQGVFFRASLQEEATRLGLTGWVRNLPDGRVEAVLQGAEGAVSDVLAVIEAGPGESTVTGIDVSDEAPDPAEIHFRVA